MISATADISGALQGLAGIPPQVMTALRDKMKILTINLQHHVVADKLQGQVLHHRTGALGRSIQTEVTESGEQVTGKVFSSGDVKYAAVHEYGFDGVVNVKPSIRTMVFGREVAPFTVAGYSYHMHMPERSFLRSSLADQAEEIVAGIQKAAIFGARQAMGE